MREKQPPKGNALTLPLIVHRDRGRGRGLCELLRGDGMNGAVAIAGDSVALKDLVVRHKVCWEVVPIWHIPRPNERVKIGFEVDLYGTHDHPQQPPIAGCDECHIVVGDLRRIANAVIPPNDRASRYVIEPYDVSISFSPRRHMRKDVLVAIDIVH